MFSGMTPGSLLLILLIVVLVFGTKKLKSLGSDVGGAVKGFRKAMNDDDKNADAAQLTDDSGADDAVKQSSQSSQHQ
ncbi:MAG: twin-arginine translocase TatA/TatE family subunit [Gammaproteobacteria bacterium]|nr:twin-arginine translocase TatA/TatE family subunit [Gammaproteobacteria bacterium]